MAGSIQLTMDGKVLEVPEGITLMDVAEEAGIHIPNLCYLKGYKGIGACRLCLVEVAGLKRPMAACTTRAKEGMEVSTQTEVLQRHRRYVIDLILSMHPMDCMTCTKASICRLQEYAYDLGLKESSFTQKRFDFSVVQDDAFIRRDPNYCVLCGRCVRVCKAQGTSVLDFFGRGVGSRVTTAADRPLQESGCTFCGSCVEVCPVNAITEVPAGGYRGREWEYVRRPSICLSCADACSTSVSVREGRVEKVNASGDSDTAEGYICAVGRFGFDSIDDDSRVRSPLQKVDGTFTAVAWEDALSVLIEACQRATTKEIVTAGNLLNEDLLTVRRLTEAAGFQGASSTVGFYGDVPSLIGGQVDIQAADLVVLVGLAPSQWERVFPALDVTLRHMVRRGAKLVVVNAEDTRIAQVAHAVLAGDEVASIQSLTEIVNSEGNPVSVNREAEQTAAGLYAQANRPVIVTIPAFSQVSHKLASKKGRVLSIPFEANGKGTLLMGITRKPTVDTDSPEVLYALGGLALSRPENTGFVISQCSHLSGLACEADLVLPVATVYESHGTIVDYAENLRTLSPVIAPCEASRLHREILQEVAQRLGLVDVSAATPEDVVEQVEGFQPGDSTSRSVEKRGDLLRNPHSAVLGLHLPAACSPRLSTLTDLRTKEDIAEAV